MFPIFIYLTSTYGRVLLINVSEIQKMEPTNHEGSKFKTSLKIRGFNYSEFVVETTEEILKLIQNEILVLDCLRREFRLFDESEDGDWTVSPSQKPTSRYEKVWPTDHEHYL